MRITRETLLRIARETAQKYTLSHPDLVAAYLTGSLRSENPFIGNATDVDIVMVHAGQPALRREILPLSPEIHLDISHNPRSEYEKPKKLRIHPWMAPELYDPLPLYGTQHFFEFVQAGVRAGYEEPVNVLARSRDLSTHARQIWSTLLTSQESSPARLLAYLKCLNHAANAVSQLDGHLLSERRFLLQFDQAASHLEKPSLTADLTALLGGSHLDANALGGLLPGWEETFRAAAATGQAAVINMNRFTYYRHAFDAMLAGASPHAILWALLHTWTLAAGNVPVESRAAWQAGCETLDLADSAFPDHMQALDAFLDSGEELLDGYAARNGIF